MGGRAHLRLDDPMAASRARLRSPPRRLAGHDPRCHGWQSATKNHPSVISKRTLSSTLAIFAAGMARSAWVDEADLIHEAVLDRDAVNRRRETAIIGNRVRRRPGRAPTPLRTLRRVKMASTGTITPQVMAKASGVITRMASVMPSGAVRSRFSSTSHSFFRASGPAR